MEYKLCNVPIGQYVKLWIGCKVIEGVVTNRSPHQETISIQQGALVFSQELPTTTVRMFSVDAVEW